MPAIQVKINADGSGFERTMKTVEKRVEGVSHSMSHGLKEAFIGFVGAGSVGLLVENMVSYAESITQASERLGIATDRIQQLRVAARHAGKDLDAFDSVFRNLDKNAAKGLVAGSKQANIAKALGLSQDDLQHLNKDELLKKALEGTNGMDRSKAEPLLGGLVGSKNAGWLLGNKESVLSGKGNTVKDDDLAALVEFKHNLEDLSDILRVALIPALTSLVQWVTKATAGYIDATRSYTDKDKQAELIYRSKHNGEFPSQIGTFFDSLHYQTGALGYSVNPFLSSDEKKQKIKELQDQHLKWSYGQDVVDELNKTYVPEVKSIQDELTETQEARKKARAEEQAAMKGPANREAPVTKTKTDKDKELLDKDLKGGSSYLKIGGLMGVDMGYRMERLSQETNNLLRQIVKNTTPQSDNSEDSLDDMTGG